MTAIEFPHQLEPQPGPQPANATESAETRQARQFRVAAIVTLVLAVVPPLLWPGDATWKWDEPKLIGQALHYNRLHALARHGLSGNFAVPYGPFPTQVYQLLLLCTHDLARLTFLRAFASSGLLAASLLWLSRTLRLTPWFAAAMVLGPFLVWTERTLWDATVAIPIGTLAVAAYASFLWNGSGKSLVTAVAAVTLVPLIHPQGLPLFAALVGHAVWRHRPALRRNRLGVGLALFVILLLNCRYVILFPALLMPRFAAPLAYGYPGRQAPLNFARSFFGPLLAGHNLTGENPVIPRTGLPGPASLAPMAIEVSLLFYVFAWVGIAGCLARLAAVRRGGGRRLSSASPTANGDVAPDLTRARDTMIGIALATLLMQMLLAAALRVPGDPQYSFGTLPVHLLFAWAGIEMLRRVWLALPLALAYGLAVGYLTVGGASSVHRYGWPRGILSPSINDQVAVARQLNRYSDKSVWTDVTTSAQYPLAMQVLRLLIPPEPGTSPVCSPHGLLLRYRPDEPPTSQFIELIDLPPGTDTVPLQPLDVTPAKPLY